MIRIILAALAGLVLTACAITPQAVPAGRFESASGLSMTLSSDWSRWAPTINGTMTNGEYLTKDGPLLNRIHLVSLKDGESFVVAPKTADVPRFVASASELERVDFVTASLERIGYNSVEASDIRPAGLSEPGGIRFGLTGKWENGADIRGDAVIAEKGGKLHVAVYLAPAMHYYAASAAEVDAAFSSLSIKG